MTKRYDVAILGGGLIGSALAVALSRQGLDVALVDPAAPEARGADDFDGRAYAVAPGSRHVLDLLAVWDRIAPNAQPIRRIEVVDRAPGPVSPAGLMFDPTEVAEDVLGWIVEDRYLRQALLEMVSTAGLDHLSPARALSVSRTTGRAEVALEDGRQLVASLVVACDGRRSATARAAGIHYLSWSYGQTGLVSAIAHELPHEGLAHQSFFPGGPFAVLPLPDNRSALVWSERDARAKHIRALDDAAYLAEIRARIGPRLGALEQVGKRWAYPLGFQLATSFAVPRLVVAGDAAHGVHPIAGQGMNLGLRDVAALTETLVEAARLGLDPGEMTVLERYQRWRRFDATAMALGMDGLNRLFSTGAAPIQALRNLGLAGVGALPEARKFFMQAASGTGSAAPRMLHGLAI